VADERSCSEQQAGKDEQTTHGGGKQA